MSVPKIREKAGTRNAGLDAVTRLHSIIVLLLLHVAAVRNSIQRASYDLILRPSSLSGNRPRPDHVTKVRQQQQVRYSERGKLNT